MPEPKKDAKKTETKPLISVALPPEEKVRLEALADRLHLSANALVRLMIQVHLRDVDRLIRNLYDFSPQGDDGTAQKK